MLFTVPFFFRKFLHISEYYIYREAINAISKHNHFNFLFCFIVFLCDWIDWIVDCHWNCKTGC